jgi:hypothetical protein
MAKICKPEYEAKVQFLTKEETERLLSRMTGKLPRRLEKDKLSQVEALAIQMELEDEQLEEWRKMMSILNKKEEAKKETKAKAAEKAKAPPKPNVAKNTKAPSKAKIAEKTKKPGE